MVWGLLAQEVATDVTWIERGGIIAVLVVIIYGFVRGYVHSDREFQALKTFGETQLKDMRDDRNLWRNMALKGATAAENATDLATKIAQGNPEVR